MKISFDPAKRAKTLQMRGLDFADALKVMNGPILTLEDDRYDYPEPRFQTYGLLNERLVMMVWTATDDGIRIISMRKCNDREQKAFTDRLG